MTSLNVMPEDCALPFMGTYQHGLLLLPMKPIPFYLPVESPSYSPHPSPFTSILPYSENSNRCLSVCFNIYLFGCGM